VTVMLGHEYLRTQDLGNDKAILCISFPCTVQHKERLIKEKTMLCFSCSLKHMVSPNVCCYPFLCCHLIFF